MLPRRLTPPSFSCLKTFIPFQSDRRSPRPARLPLDPPLPGHFRATLPPRAEQSVPNHREERNTTGGAGPSRHHQARVATGGAGCGQVNSGLSSWD